MCLLFLRTFSFDLVIESVDLRFPAGEECSKSCIDAILDLITKNLQVEEYLNTLDERLLITALKCFLKPGHRLVVEGALDLFKDFQLLSHLGYVVG